MCHARHSLDSEDGLRLGTEGDGGSSLLSAKLMCPFSPWPTPSPPLFSGPGDPRGVLLKGVRNAIFLQQRKKVCRILIDDDVLSRYVNSESVWGEVFAVLCPQLASTL